MLFITRKAGLTHDQFVDYYENRHIPLIDTLLPPLQHYRRNYVRSGDLLSGGDVAALGFDVVTEIRFSTQEAADEYFVLWNSPAVRERIIPDETNFVECRRTKLFKVDQHDS